MGFGDLKSQQGLQALNNYLQDKSYIEGYVPSQADAVVFAALSGPPAAELAHALRWYRQVDSYGSEKSSFPGQKKDVSAYGSAVANKAGGDADSDDDDDFDLFDDDDEAINEAAEKLKEKRLAEYAAKKANKKQIIAKSNIKLDVKPWSDETDMAELERCVRSVEMDGLLWGASKLVPVGYGIKKLQIVCVIEDDKVSVDDLEEKIQQFEEHIQSTDIASFQKI